MTSTSEGEATPGRTAAASPGKSMLPSATPLVVDVAFPFTLATPPFGASRPFVGDHAAKAAYVDALEAELASLDDEVRARPVRAVRLSGGASIMSPDKVCHLVRAIRKTFALGPGAEISLDVEPITVGTPSLTDWTSCGIGCINLLALSVHDEELAAVGANHNREQLQNALLFLGRFHVPHVSLELAYGLPGQTPTSWENTLRTATDLGCSAVRVRPLVDGRASTLESRRALYALACEMLPARGYAQHTLGDFARPDTPHARGSFDAFVSGGADVLGLGAGAHTRMDGFLYENACDFDLYVRESANFEAIVRNPLLEDNAMRTLRVEPPVSQATIDECFEALEHVGATIGR